MREQRRRVRDRSGSSRTANCPGNETSYTYDGYGSRNSVTDALGRVTSMTYDARGNLLTLTDAAGNTTTFTYSAEDDLLTKTDPLGRTTSYSYDADGNLLSTTDALSGVTSFTHDGQGQLLTATDPRGKTSSFTYNAHGYQSSATDPLLHTTTFGYDAGGRLLSQTDPLGQTTTFAYDDVDRLLTVTNALGHATAYAYDPNGNKTSVTDANGKVTLYTYDLLDRLSTVTDAEGGIVTYGYDDVGNRTSMLDANGHTTQYQYDALNRLVKVIDPVGNQTTYTYDAVGNRKTRKDGNGVTTSYSYDALNRLTKIIYPDQPSVTYTYDALGNRLTMTDLTGTTAYGYGALYRLTSVTRGSEVISYAYDAAGNRTGITYPDGKRVDYIYDDASRLDTVTDWASRVTDYAYDNASRLTGTLYPSGVNGSRSYNNANQLAAIGYAKTGNLWSVSYGLDDVGNRLSRTQTVGAGPAQPDVYGYDDLYRLTSVDYAAYDDQTYVYDPMGNRTSFTEGVTPTAYTYVAADRILAAGSTTYAFDQNGNQVREGNRSFVYDREDRLIQVADWPSQPAPGAVCADTNWDGTVDSGDLLAVANIFNAKAGTNAYEPVRDPKHDGAVNAGDLLQVAVRLTQQCAVAGASAYSGDGLRVDHSESGGSSRYHWDIAAALPVIVQDSVGTSYLYGNELVLEETASVPSYYHADGLGSTVLTTDSAGASTGTYEYDVYGAPRLTVPTFGYTGQQGDGSGLLYLRARSYDITTGRFSSRDDGPMISVLSSSLNRYVYAANNTALTTDPTGLCWSWAQGICNYAGAIGKAAGDAWTQTQENAEAFVQDPGAYLSATKDIILEDPGPALATIRDVATTSATFTAPLCLATGVACIVTGTFAVAGGTAGTLHAAWTGGQFLGGGISQQDAIFELGKDLLSVVPGFRMLSRHFMSPGLYDLLFNGVLPGWSIGWKLNSFAISGGFGVPK